MTWHEREYNLRDRLSLNEKMQIWQHLSGVLEGDETKLKWLVTFKIEPNVT